MTSIRPVVLALSVLSGLTVLPAVARASEACRGVTVDVLIDGQAVRQYAAFGTRYIEALRGKEYAIRLTNPFDVRVAVALAVDGLNTIDARRTTAFDARKWVIGPHETVVISGWQVSMEQARHFFFTTEGQSYAERLGAGENLGLISAVVFRERPAPRPVPVENQETRGRSDQAAPPAAAGAPSAAGTAKSEMARPAGPDDYAATGIGSRTEHRVEYVHLELESQPTASINIRYQYRSQLVRLGVIPPGPASEDPLDRRQKASGFNTRFCPDVR